MLTADYVQKMIGTAEGWRELVEEASNEAEYGTDLSRHADQAISALHALEGALGDLLNDV